MDVRYLVLILLLLLASCMPESSVSRGNLASTNATGGTTSGTGTGTGTTNTPTTVSWNYLNSVSKLITINVSNLNTAYIVGLPVESFLATSGNFQSNYCLVTTYSVSGVSRELRSRIVPISYYDFTAKRTVKIYRVDFPDLTNSANTCSKTTRVQDSSGNYITDPLTPPASLRTFDPSQICPNCTTTLIATKVRIFKTNTTDNTLDEVATTFVNTNLLSLQVDPNNSAGNNNGTCSNSSCTALGFSCCLDNQCVRDGAQKPSASSQYPALLQTAEQERIQNPLAYLNYPQLYYICGTTVPTNGGSSGGGTTGGTPGYDAAFEQLKKDYSCIQNLKSQASTSPFHNELTTKTYTPSANCLTGATETLDTFYYLNVIKRLYQTCGCNKTEIIDMINTCPNYDYTVTTKDTAGNPVRIDCYTPPTGNNPVPNQQTVSVSSRSAPHRFFDINGAERSPSEGIEQEGSKFEYLDSGKILPQQESFSMNAILGQMSVTLDKALPAKAVNVEIDQVYFIQTTSGYYTPCPTCGKDSWFESFTAYPATSFGNGLQAIGHSTERDSFSTNTTGGNYEDTIFGRACWLPPTMIPFSHSPKATVQAQRMNRLETQATLFVNGYQRDWYGFNKGALIGSFDGVSWFAVGTGRIVRSTTKKLYLAINAPFADLANSSIHVVNVQAYDGVTQAAQVDYDPTYHQTHPLQNQAANCQRFHYCSTDTDCVTKLGWEYSCADVKDLKTNWPQFDPNGNEIANSSTNVTIDQILAQKKFSGTTTKRCVYRGSGALCHSDVGLLLSSDLNKTKLLTCAPNFHCANAGNSQHNSKIARYAATLEEIPVSRNHFFGKDANVLGRPDNYIGSSGVNNNVRITLNENLVTNEPSMNSYTGLCQPGKALPTPTSFTTLSNPFNQHKGTDSSQRTDFISQIGSCNSGLFNNVYRHSSCPVIGSDGNYEIFNSATLPAGLHLRATAQNACGLESLLTTASLASSADSLTNFSPFRSIEAKPLNVQTVVEPTFARDACFRRAGSVCHTDLDCSPNKLHASQVDTFAQTFFGNSAEKSYWSEYLVCGQTDPKPNPTNVDAFKNYDMSKNRCCREIGKDLTTYTADLPTSTASGSYDPNTVGLKMSLPPGFAPNDAKRYSRLATVEDIGAVATKPVLSAFQDSSAGLLVPNPSYSLGTNVASPYQWRTLTEANSESCCGGGWIRKFADGSNDWTKNELRLSLDVTNFRCINSTNVLLTHPEDVEGEYTGYTPDVRTLVNQDYNEYCVDAFGVTGNCAQFSILDSILDTPPDTSAVHNYNNQNTIVNTLNPSFSSNRDYYFMPKSADGNGAVIVNYADTSTTARRNIVIKIPSYISRAFDSSISVSMIGDNNVTTPCSPGFNPTSPTQVNPGGTCGYSYDPTTRVLKAGLSAATATASYNNRRVGLTFSVPTAGSATPTVDRNKPGTSSYYLRRLGKLELSGIPQITFEALTCSDNSFRVVEGILKPNIKFKSQFDVNSFSFDDGTARVTNVHGLQLDPVFSSNDFKCCSPLGRTVTDATKCCSGFAAGDSSSGMTCALPRATDLMVYFNRFVSNEGVGSDKPGGGLVESDFDPKTGEPLLGASVNDKIRALGNAYCASGKVRQGGAFGSYEPEPQGTQTNLSNRIYGIVDSARDAGQLSNAGTTINTGYNAFTDGFRWNHHLYCDD